ncbi:MAG TPA: hypothetical protein VE669_06660, partial [Actinomycetota bacterium]|nr:hypothetical protein [Actinomycetota bacterium]
MQRVDVEPEVPAVDPSERARRRRRRQGRAIWIAGLVLILAALGVGGYLAWLLWGTGLSTQAAQRDLRPDFAAKVASKTVEEAPEPERVVKV